MPHCCPSQTTIFSDTLDLEGLLLEALWLSTAEAAGRNQPGSEHSGELPGTANLKLIKIMVPSGQLEETRTVNIATVPSDKVKILTSTIEAEPPTEDVANEQLQKSTPVQGSSSILNVSSG
jgi:hypothetical protein